MGATRASTVVEGRDSRFPEIKGFSHANLKYIWWQCNFYQSLIAQHPVVRLSDIVNSVPWRHHLQMIPKCKEAEEPLYFRAKTAEHGWGRNIFVRQIEHGLYKRKSPKKGAEKGILTYYFYHLDFAASLLSKFNRKFSA